MKRIIVGDSAHLMHGGLRRVSFAATRPRARQLTASVSLARAQPITRLDSAQLHWHRPASTSPSSSPLQDLLAPSMSSSASASGSLLTPPVPPPAWTSFTPAAIESSVSTELELTRSLLDSLAALEPHDCSFDAVFRALALREAAFDTAVEPLLFMQYVATDAATRDESVTQDKRVQDFGLEATMRKDVYVAMCHARDNTDRSQLSAEEQRLSTSACCCHCHPAAN